ncbi:MAG: glycoside hydrolase family 5 protein [Actinomycetota bacterium]|nr:glycoside hydrolase family 5 protein [Actinomycetota bacterium]
MRPFSKLKLVVTAMALTAAILTTTGTAKARPPSTDKPAFGATFHGVWNYSTDAERNTALQRFKNSGGTWIRTDLMWSDIEPSRGTYDAAALARYDNAVNLASAKGLKVLAVISTTPAWAHQGSSDILAPPSDPATYAAFAASMAQRFKGKVNAIELWNEPNSSDFFTPSSEGNRVRDYFAMEKAAYVAVKGADPTMTVMAAGVSYVDDAWWSKLYQLGISRYTDAVAVHPYMSPSNLPPSAPDDGGIWRINHLPALIAVMTKYGDATKPIWLTEFGWSSHSSPSPENWNQGVTEAQQAQYLQGTLELLSAQYPQVTNVFWYNLRDRTDSTPQENNYGLLNTDLSPKPAMATLYKIYRLRGGWPPS